MVRFSFRRGLVFLQQTRAFKLIKRLANGKLQFEDKAGALEAFSESEIHGKWREGEWQIDEASLSAAANVFYTTAPRDLASFPKEDQDRAKRCDEYLRRIEQKFKEQGSRFVSTPARLEPLIEEIAKERGDGNSPCAATVTRWWKKFAPTRCVTKFAIDRTRSGRQVDVVQRSLFDEAVEEIYLTKQKLPGKDVVERLEEKIKRVNSGVETDKCVAVPSAATVYRWLKELYGQVVSAAREGKTLSDRKFRSVTSGLRVKRILERIELDHTALDILVICKLTKMVLGRPWITIAVDRFSRMIVGFYIAFHAPSATSVLQCLRQAVYPKDSILKRFKSVVGPWPARGMATTCAVDNGMDLHAGDVEVAALEMGIELHFMGAGHPELKGAIERLIGTLNRDLMHKLPGTTFANPKQRGDYDSEKEAAIDLEVLTEIVTKWIVDVYHKTPHRGLRGKTPLQAWQEGEKERVIELPAFPRQFDLVVSASATRTVFHYGVQHDNLFYNSPLLQEIRRRDGGTPIVHLRAFEHDVSMVSVLDPILKEYIDVPAVDMAYAHGLNRHVHRLIFEEVRQRFGANWSAEDLRTAKRDIQSMVEQALKDKKLGNRKAAAAAMAANSDSIIYEYVTPQALADALQPLEPGATQTSCSEEDDEGEVPNFSTVPEDLEEEAMA